MSVDRNCDRIMYYSPSDLAAGLQREQIFTLLSAIEDEDFSDINEAIELHQCVLTVENCTDFFPRDVSGFIERKVKLAKSKAYKFIHQLTKESIFINLFENIELQYRSRIWNLIAVSGASSCIDSHEIVAVLGDNLHLLPNVLEEKILVKYFGTAIADLMRRNIKQSAELLVNELAIQHSNERPQRHFPEELGNEDKNDILRTYLGLEDPNINYVKAVSSWPQRAEYVPASTILVEAKRKATALNAKLFPDVSDASPVVSMEIEFSDSQYACKGLRLIQRTTRITYGTAWLRAHPDNATILNNFIYVFEYANRNGILAQPYREPLRSSIADIIGLHVKGEYPGHRNNFFKLTLNRHEAIVFLYNKVLKEKGMRIESALEWFYSEYLSQEFGVSGFFLHLSNDETTHLDRCRSIGPAIEGVIKSFSLYREHGEIDSDFFPHICVKDFSEIKSLIENKYYVGGNPRFRRIAFYLFSNQSNLVFSEKHKGCDTFWEILLTGKAKKNDFPEQFRCILDSLAEDGVIQIEGDDDIITQTQYTQVIKAIVADGAFSSLGLPDESRALLEEMSAKGLLDKSQGLLTPAEADYFNYMFNDARFNNSLGLRNKYDHASFIPDDPNDAAIKTDYALLLSLLIEITLKINEEFCYLFDGGWIEDFVDWPLVDDASMEQMLGKREAD